MVKSLLLKHEDPSLDPQHPGGNPGVEEACPCKSWHWGGGDQHIPEHAGWSSSQISELQVQRETLSQKIRVLEKDS